MCVRGTSPVSLHPDAQGRISWPVERHEERAFGTARINIGGSSLDLRDYLLILRRHWILITAASLVGLLIGALATMLVRPTYTAETQLFVAIQGSGSIQELQQGNTFSQARIQSYVKTVTSPLVLQPALDTLGLSVSPDELQPRVKATADPNTVLINISVEDESPVQAAAIAQAVATSLISAVERLERPTAATNSVVSLSITKPATAPASPSAPNTRTSLIMGLVAGLIFGLAAAFARFTLDNKIRGESDLRRLTDAAVLGGIAYDEEAKTHPLIAQSNRQSPRAESFRRLRTNLQFANVSTGAQTFAVTSSLPGEGKTTTAANLAIALAETGHSVCLIDADLRRPMVGEYFGLDRNAGLTTALLGHTNVEDLLQPWGDHNLHILASGQIPPNPSELLGSAAMEGVIQHLETIFDTIVIDAPPLLPVTDAAVLSQHVGGMLLVVGSMVSKDQAVQRSLAALQMVDATLLGVVLNRLPGKGPDAYAYTYYNGPEELSPASATTLDEPRIQKSSGRSTFLSAELMQNGVNYGNQTVDITSPRKAGTFPKGLQ